MGAGARLGLKVTSVLIGIPVGIASKKVVERAWHAIRPGNPPRKPTEPEVRWADAVGWAALSAAGVVVGELITRRSAEATYRAITGSPPPPPKSKSKSAKKSET